MRLSVRTYAALLPLMLGAIALSAVPSCKQSDDLIRQLTAQQDASAFRAHAISKARRRVVLHTRKKAGVPVHPKPSGRSKVSGHIFGGIEVSVLDKTKDGKWLLVKSDQGLVGWVSHKYIDKKSRHQHSGTKRHRGHRQKAVQVPSASPWSSPLACASALGKQRPAHRVVVRVATWNLRWFPYGSTRRSPPKRTDLDWMACSMASLDVQAIAVQEVVRDAEGRRAMTQLLRGLNRLTHGRWKAAFDDCPGKGRQHVGVLWDSRRLRGKVTGRVDQLNPGQDGCSLNLRPGEGVYLRSNKGGLDFHLVSVHLDSGTTTRDYEHRRRSVRGIAAAYGDLFQRVQDKDMLVMGDFNTMGCEERGGCRPAVGWQQEVRLVEQQVMRQHPVFRMLAVAPRCTEYYKGRGQVLDQVLVSGGMAEAASVIQASSAGVCKAVSCQRVSEKRAAAMRTLSDHCPVVVEIPDKDDD